MAQDTGAFGSGAAPTVGVGGIQSLKDLSNPNLLADPALTTGLTADAAKIGQKFSDLGFPGGDIAGFASSLTGVAKPAIPTLNSAASSLSGLMSGQSSVLKSMTGEDLASASSPNNGIGGLPSMKDFLGPLVGGPAIDDIVANGATVDTIAKLQASVSKASSLFSNAGIDVDSPPPKSLGSAMSFAKNLHKFGQDVEMSSIMGDLAMPNSQFGDAIKSSLVEGKNNALLAAHGIKPPSFNPFEGLPGDPTADPNGDAAKLLGGG